MSIAIVGSGPAGCYAADGLSRALPGQQIDLFERLALPFGLVRYGVAPDHPGTKAVARIFERVLARPNVRLVCNTEVGKSISLAELESQYDIVVLATGAGIARQLTCPGIEQAINVAGMNLSAWFNGHPGIASGVLPAGPARAVCIVGNGNVSLDAARLLAMPVEALERASVPEPVIAWREGLGIEEIHICGRGSAASARFSVPELMELAALPGFRPVIDARDVAACESGSNLEALEILRNFQALLDSGRRPIRFHFGQLIHSFANQSLVTSNHRNEMAEIPASMVIHAIGHRAVAIDGAPFDDSAGCIPNHAGLVVGKTHTYVVGWAAHAMGGGIAESRNSARALLPLITAKFGAGS
ncbi:MAG: Ferredoxin--NADP(+) reductase [Paucimonas sp.]|nr:Ferredoxin--NADP(+) reductase [Paucimonas sp.]